MIVYQLVLFLLITIVTIYILSVYSDYESLLYYVIPINLIFDILVLHLTSSDGSGIIGLLRVLYIVLIFLFLFIRRIKLNIIFYSFILLFIYYLLLIIIRGIDGADVIQGVDLILRVFIPLFFGYIAFTYLDTIEKMRKVNVSLLYTLIIFIGYLLAANIFSFGINLYNTQEDLELQNSLIKTGAFLGNTFNTLAYLLILAPLIYKYNKEINTLLLNIFIALGFIFLILTFRRSAIFIVMFAYIIYSLYLFRFNKSLYKNIILILFLIIVTFPIYSNFLNTIIEIRGERGSNPFSTSTIKAEDRTSELYYVFNKITFSNNISTILFGDSFKTQGVNPFASKNRELHSDFAVLLVTSGYVGILLYFLYHLAFIYLFIKNRDYRKEKILIILFVVLLTTSIFLSYSGRFTVITFRSIIFLYLGMILSILKNNKGNIE